MKRGRSDMFEVGCSFAPVASIDDEEGGGGGSEDGGFKALPDIDRVTCTRLPAWALIGIGVRLSQLGGNQKLSRAAGGRLRKCRRSCGYVCGRENLCQESYFPVYGLSSVNPLAFALVWTGGTFCINLLPNKV